MLYLIIKYLSNNKTILLLDNAIEIIIEKNNREKIMLGVTFWCQQLPVPD